MEEFFQAVERHKDTATGLLVIIIFITCIIADAIKSKKES